MSQARPMSEAATTVLEAKTKPTSLNCSLASCTAAGMTCLRKDLGPTAAMGTSSTHCLSVAPTTTAVTERKTA
eukprot:766773-Lingulodinium_polyedra.AAC.1